MTTIIADAAMKAALGHVKGLAEVRSDDGAVIGYFAPSSMDQARRYAEAAAKTDWAEIERRDKANRPGHTLRQVFQHLQTLTSEESERADLQKYIDELAAEER